MYSRAGGRLRRPHIVSRTRFRRNSAVRLSRAAICRIHQSRHQRSTRRENPSSYGGRYSRANATPISGAPGDYGHLGGWIPDHKVSPVNHPRDRLRLLVGQHMLETLVTVEKGGRGVDGEVALQ